MSVFSGLDHISCAFNAGTCIVLALVGCWVAPHALLPHVIGLGLIATILAAGARYRLRISTEGIEWALLAAWIVPVKRLRYLLDAKVDVYESFEADKPEGLCICPVRIGEGEEDSACFGPSFGQAAIASLRERAMQAILDARKLLPATPVEFRSKLLAAQMSKVGIGGSKRSWQGRLREARVIEALSLGQLVLPEGSVLELNGEDYLDPRREDQLRAAIVPQAVRLPVGLDVPPGTRISFARDGRIAAVRGPLGPRTIEGFKVDGEAPIGFDDSGAITSFTLGEEMEFGGWKIGKGTTLASWPAMGKHGPAWYCTLGRPLRLPELELEAGDAVVVEKKSGRLLLISPRGEAEVDGERLGAGPISVSPEGKIDRTRARKRR